MPASFAKIPHLEAQESKQKLRLMNFPDVIYANAWTSLSYLHPNIQELRQFKNNF
jgi:hypothetical protein